MDKPLKVDDSSSVVSLLGEEGLISTFIPVIQPNVDDHPENKPKMDVETEVQSNAAANDGSAFSGSVAQLGLKCHRLRDRHPYPRESHTTCYCLKINGYK